MIKKTYETQEQFDELYNQSALTWEGMSDSSENLEQIEKWLNDHGVDTSKAAFVVTKGGRHNELYGLHGDNAYPEDLTILSVTGIDYHPIVMARFSVGGRWFDDIVANNLSREKR